MKKSFILPLLFLLLALSECKKGPDDPLFSLRTRKARLTGEWKLTKGTSLYTYSENLVEIRKETTYDGSSFVTKETSNVFGTITDTTVKSSFTYKLTFEKDGTFSLETEINGIPSKDRGTWNFTGGIGDKKNKEQIALHIESSEYNGNKVDITGNYLDVIYDLQELRNKKIVLKQESTKTETSSGNQTSSSYKMLYTLER